MFAAYSNCLPIATTCSPDYRIFPHSTGFYVQIPAGFEAKIECGRMHRLTASRRRRRQRIRLRLRLAVKRMTFP